MDTTILRFEGAPNFREVSGYRTPEGRRLKRGRIYRSGELSNLTDADLRILRDLGIGLVVDLRDAKETGVLVSRWPEGLSTEFHNADVSLDVRLEGRPIIDVLIENSDPVSVERIVGRGFPVIAEFCGPALKYIADRLSGGSEPILFHCTNGRDRTGVISAMLLYILGMPRDAIIADFMITNERINAERVIANTLETYRKAMGIEMTREAIEPATLVRASYIEVMLKGLAEKFGSPEGYLEHFGIDAALCTAIREHLLED